MKLKYDMIKPISKSSTTCLSAWRKRRLKMFKHLTKEHQNYYGAIAVISAIVFAVIFSAVFIFSAFKLNENLDNHDKYPLEIASNSHEMRKNISHMEVDLGRLTSDTSPQTVRLVKRELEISKNEVKKNLDYLDSFYLGPPQNVSDIKQALSRLYRQQDKVLEAASGHASLNNYIYVDMVMFYDDVDRQILKVIDFTKIKRREIAEKSAFFVYFSIAVSLSLLLLIIGLAILLQYRASRNFRERQFQDNILKIIAENVENVFLLFNSRTKSVEYVSHNALRILGISHLDLISSPMLLADLCTSENADYMPELLSGNTFTKPVSHEVQLKNPATGEVRWMSISLYPVRKNNEGFSNRYILMISDLTEVRRAQEVLKDALVNAQNANDAKSSFLSRMSHEIRTPMNAIIGMTAIATSALNDRKKIENCLSKIAFSSRHLMMLINDVLDMSKIESGKLTLVHEPFELSDLISNLGSIIYPQASSKKQEFDISVNVTNENLIGDVLRVNQILINLLSNAIKFTPEGGHIRLKIEEIKKRYESRVWLRFTVSDDGRGMSSEFVEKIFVPFEQEMRTTRLVEGTGLGMPITKNLVTLMNGVINVQSEMDKGSTFMVDIGFDVSDEKRTKQPFDIEKLKILVVDDDIDTCEHTSLILDRMGMSAEWVMSGKDAIASVMKAHASSDDYDVVFIDWKMPEMDGIETTRRIRKKLGPDTLIIIISAYDWSDIESEAREAGANAFISKPMLQSSIYHALVSVSYKPRAAIPEKDTNLSLVNKNILVAEDNSLNQEIMMELLKQKGAKVEIATNGLEVVDKFANSFPGTYDLILMDIQMPYCDGYEATKAIRCLDRRDSKSIPIIAMTANVFASDIAASKAAGMNGHLGKPVDLNLLYWTIAGQMEKMEYES